MPNREGRVFRALKSKFVTLPQEELILVQRKHWSVFVFPGVIAIVFVLLSFIATIGLSFMAPNLILLSITAFSLIFIFTITLVLKSIIDWYFNLYVVTNRKIAEVVYRPLSGRHINEVLLDQVRCTEIDTRIEGIVNELLDVGDVIITFDRPTHQEEFVFTYVPNPKKMEATLHKTLNPIRSYTNAQPGNGARGSNAWYVKSGNGEGNWKYVEEIKNESPNGKIGGETTWNL